MDRFVGHRKERPLSFNARADLFIEGVRFNDTLGHLPTGNTTGIRKGVARFRTHEEANAAWLEGVAEEMARRQEHI
jgi:hypothetical protein